MTGCGVGGSTHADREGVCILPGGLRWGILNVKIKCKHPRIDSLQLMQIHQKTNNMSVYNICFFGGGFSFHPAGMVLIKYLNSLQTLTINF